MYINIILTIPLPQNAKKAAVLSHGSFAFGLALDRADGQALDEVLLEEGVRKADRTNGNNSHGHTEGFGG